MRADFAVVLDACVLAEAAVSDLFLRLSEEPRLLLPKWSQEIWREARHVCIDKLGWPEELAANRFKAATSFFPEAMVSGYEHLLVACANHPRDRHVLAAAIHAKCETIVTFNVKDFKPTHLEPWGIVASHPADYLLVLFEHEPAAVTAAIHRMAEKVDCSIEAMLGRLAWYVPSFAQRVANELALDLIPVRSADWRRATGRCDK